MYPVTVTLVISSFFLSQQVLLPFILSCLSFWAVIRADNKFCGKMVCTFDLCFTKIKSRMSKTFFFLLRGSFIFQTEAWGQLSYGIKNIAMDMKISCVIRVATGLAGCLVLEKKNSQPLINLKESGLHKCNLKWKLLGLNLHKWEQICLVKMNPGFLVC